MSDRISENLSSGASASLIMSGRVVRVLSLKSLVVYHDSRYQIAHTRATMQNPFVRLKHYRRDSTHPLENHATETLAACLILSDNIRREFIRFLFQDKLPFDPGDGELFDVTTQAQLGNYGIVDLLLEQTGTRNIVVEVKVHALEDGQQITKYRRWLQETKKGENFVFSLVRNPSRRFDITKHGGNGRTTWKELYDFLLNRGKSLTEAPEIKIIEHFCNYLEVEGIVSNWTPAQIVDYGRGLIAKRALHTLFKRVEEKLLTADPSYTTNIVMPDAAWPRLEVGMKGWSSIFGPKGYLNKVLLYYQTKAVWDGEFEGFYFEIVLWQRHHRCEWKVTEQRLSRWIQILKQHNFDHSAVLKGTRELEKDASEHKFAEQPWHIIAWAGDPAKANIREAEVLEKSESELVDGVFERAVELCGIVSSFG